MALAAVSKGTGLAERLLIELDPSASSSVRITTSLSRVLVLKSPLERMLPLGMEGSCLLQLARIWPPVVSANVCSANARIWRKNAGGIITVCGMPFTSLLSVNTRTVMARRKPLLLREVEDAVEQLDKVGVNDNAIEPRSLTTDPSSALLW